MCSADLATDVDLLSVLPFTLFTDILEKRDKEMNQLRHLKSKLFLLEQSESEVYCQVPKLVTAQRLTPCTCFRQESVRH